MLAECSTILCLQKLKGKRLVINMTDEMMSEKQRRIQRKRAEKLLSPIKPRVHYAFTISRQLYCPSIHDFHRKLYDSTCLCILLQPYNVHQTVLRTAKVFVKCLDKCVALIRRVNSTFELQLLEKPLL